MITGQEAAPVPAVTIDIQPLLDLARDARARGDHAAAMRHCATAAAAAGPGNPWPRIDHAHSLRALGHDGAAAAMLATVVADHPGQVEALLSLGHIARARGDHAAALGHFASAVPGAGVANPWPLVEQATELRILGRLEEADALFAEVLAEHPALVQALLGRGHIARARGEHAAALGHFAAAAAVAGPEDPWPRTDQATELRILGRLEEAEALYAEVVAGHPTQVEALFGLGHLARARGDHPAALDRFAAAAEASGPDNPWPRLEQATQLRILNRPAEAAEAYAAVLAHHPRHVEALLGLGHAELALGDHESALGRYAAAEAVTGPDNPWPRLDRAAALRLCGRLDEAEALWTAVLADHPGQAQALLGLGRAARDRGDHAAAAERFRQVTELAPEEAAGWTELAAELRDAGDVGGARAIGERLADAAPDDLQAWMSLGRTERAAGRRAAALEAFRRAHGCAPQDPYPLVEIATELWALDQPAEARQHLEEALSRDPDCLQALEQLGELDRVARDLSSADALFRRVIGLRPGNPWAWLGLMRVLSDRGQPAEALALLAEAEAQCGPLPELAAGRIGLLRQQGLWPEALRRARAAQAESPRHMGLWIERFRVERLLATPEALDACLAAAPAATAPDEARVAQFRGQAAEEAWEIEAAVRHYEQSLALRPDDSWTLTDLVRARILALDLPGAREELRRLARLTGAHARVQGRSANVSQTHFGQLLDEFALDAEALARLVALRGLAPAARIEPLRALVREFPDYTPAAMLLLIALRRAGRLATPARGKAAIPAGIMQYWDSGNPPAEIAALMAGWRVAHPGHRHRVFDDAAAQAFLRAQCPPEVLAAYRRSREPAQKADLFRLAWLQAEGGWWIDADDRCLAPIGSVAAPGAGLVLYQEDYGTVGNNVIGTVPRHPVIGRALEAAVAAVNRGDSDILWFATGPGLLTRAVAAALAAPGTPPAWLKRIQVLPRVAMHQAVAMHCEVGYKNTERHWSRTAFAHRAGRPAAAVPPARPAALPTAPAAILAAEAAGRDAAPLPDVALAPAPSPAPIGQAAEAATAGHAAMRGAPAQPGTTAKAKAAPKRGTAAVPAPKPAKAAAGPSTKSAAATKPAPRSGTPAAATRRASAPATKPAAKPAKPAAKPAKPAAKPAKPAAKPAKPAAKPTKPAAKPVKPAARAAKQAAKATRRAAAPKTAPKTAAPKERRPAQGKAAGKPAAWRNAKARRPSVA